MKQKASLIADRKATLKVVCRNLSAQLYDSLTENEKRILYLDLVRGLLNRMTLPDMVRRLAYLQGQLHQFTPIPQVDLPGISLIARLRKYARSIASQEVPSVVYFTCNAVDAMLEAADRLERFEKDMWRLNDELAKCGMEPWQYDSFASCVAVLRQQRLNGELNSELEQEGTPGE